MRYAIIADIHSNLNALQAVLADLKTRAFVDEIWCLGDIVGYGPDPHQCLELVRTYCAVCVMGNHDQAASGQLDISTFNLDAAKAILWHRQQLNKNEIQFLSNLPQKVIKDDFTLVHGSPREPIWEYILSARQAEENLLFFSTSNCAVGHSHIAQYSKCDITCNLSKAIHETTLNLIDSRYIINPGSVGQPRDGDVRAGYAVYDSRTFTLIFYRVVYDITAVQARMKKTSLPIRLIERLALGR